MIPQAGQSWQPEGAPKRRPHEYIRGGTVKLLTLFRPATGELRAQPVQSGTNEVLHGWLKPELTTILASLPPTPSPGGPSEARRWRDWSYRPDSHLLDEALPPRRLLLIWDNLTGHYTDELVQWCHDHGIGLLYTPLSGSWLNQAESIQRIIQRRALEGQDPKADAEQVKSWLEAAVRGWNRQPTPFVWGGKRHARRDRAYARRHRLAGSGATTSTSLRRRSRSVRLLHASHIGSGIGK